MKKKLWLCRTRVKYFMTEKEPHKYFKSENFFEEYFIYRNNSEVIGIDLPFWLVRQVAIKLKIGEWKEIDYMIINLKDK